MAKTIKLNYKGKEYTLEFNRETVRSAERSGFNLTEIADKPVSTIEALVYASFRMHHPTMSSKKAVEIYDSLNHKDEFVNKLIELYGSVVEAFTGSDANSDEEAEGNANWDADF